jgi:hypothetical protein
MCYIHEHLKFSCCNDIYSGTKSSVRFGLKKKQQQEAVEISIMSIFTICTAPNVIRIIKSRAIRWARHVAYMCTSEMHKHFGSKE